MQKVENNRDFIYIPYCYGMILTGGEEMAVLLVVEDDLATNEAICEYMKMVGHSTRIPDSKGKGGGFGDLRYHAAEINRFRGVEETPGREFNSCFNAYCFG